MQAAESRIRDANMANLMVNYVRDQILNQAGTAMLAQANQRATAVLSLLQ
jgi:flagellin